MKRVIVHWTAGSYTPSAIDREHYHYLIDGAGDLHKARPVEQNDRSVAGLSSDDYAAHTRGLNSYSIGVALCAMHGARERPFSPGQYPITPAQVRSLTAFLVTLMETHDIPLSRETVLTHAEVQPTLGVWQRGKWDVMWWPGMDGPADPVAAGDMMRERVKEAINASEPEPPRDTASLNRAIEQEMRTHQARLGRIIREYLHG